MTVDALADELSISRETIRRDLTELADRGQLRKFHGGAMLSEISGEGAFAVRMGEALREKRNIARAAAGLFHAGDTMLVDTGSTTVLFAEELARNSGLTVITNSLMIAQILGRAPANHKVFVLGGEYNAEVGENLGTLTIEQIAAFHVDHAVITVGGVGVGGMMDFDIEEARVAKAMIAQASAVTVIADSSKLGRTALFQVCSLRDVDRLVLDKAPSGALAEALAAASIEIIVAEDDRKP